MSRFSTEWESEIAIPGVRDPDLVGAHGQIASGIRVGGKMPEFATFNVLVALQAFLAVGLNGGQQVSIRGPNQAELVSNEELHGRLGVLVRHAECDPYTLHTSIEGLVRQITSDKRPKHEAHYFQVIDRVTGVVVRCNADRHIVDKIDGHTGERIVVHGVLTCAADDKPKTIKVDDYSILPPESELPSIADIHAMGADISANVDAADFVRGLRDANEG